MIYLGTYHLIFQYPHGTHSPRIITIFALQLGMTLFVLLGLSVLRFDAGRLVLGPLRRMLKIVAFCKYATLVR